MSTRLQEKLANEIVKDAKNKRPRQKKQLLVAAGYTEITASANPAIILEAQGVKEALKERGFDEDSAKRVVSEILHNPKVKPHDRLDAADKVFKVQGSYSPVIVKNLNLGISLDDERKRILDDIFPDETHASTD